MQAKTCLAFKSILSKLHKSRINIVEEVDRKSTSNSTILSFQDKQYLHSLTTMPVSKARLCTMSQAARHIRQIAVNDM